METIILGSCVALATGISAYAVWRTKQLTEEVTSHTAIVTSARNDVNNKAWLQSKHYSEELAKQYNEFTKQINSNDKFLNQLLTTVATENRALEGSLNSLKGYIANTKQELSSVIDGKFAQNKQDLERMREELNTLRSKTYDLDKAKVNVASNNAEVETLYQSINALSEELNQRIDALAVTINKVTIDKLAKGEREIYELLKLDIKQSEIAKRLHTTEPRVSKVKKDLIAKGLLE